MDSEAVRGGSASLMKKVSTGVLTIILAGGLSLVVAGHVMSRAETVYTVPQVLASLPALRGRTILVRSVFGLPGWHGSSWRPAPRPCQQNCPITYALDGEPVYKGKLTYTIPELFVTVGPQDPILAALRQIHVLPSRVQITDKLHVYRVQIAVHPTAPCVGYPPCPRAVLLDTLR
jgi:hypothetical protein